MVKNSFVPGQVEELDDLHHPLPGMQRQLLVVDGEAACGAHPQALRVHVLHGHVPLLQAVAVALQVKARDGHSARDDGVDNGAPIADHQQELGAGELLGQVDGGLEREWVLVAQPGCRLPVLGHHLQDERPHGRVQHLPSHTRGLQTLLLHTGFLPLCPEAQDPGYDPSLLPASYMRVSVQHDSHQRGSTARHATHEDDLHVLSIRDGTVVIVVNIMVLFLGHHDVFGLLLTGHGQVHNVEDRQNAKQQEQLPF